MGKSKVLGLTKAQHLEAERGIPWDKKFIPLCNAVQFY